MPVVEMQVPTDVAADDADTGGGQPAPGDESADL